MMFPIKDIDLLEFITNELDKYIEELCTEIKDYRFIWLERMRIKDGLTFTRKYGNDAPKYSDYIILIGYESRIFYSGKIKEWIENVKPEESDFIHVRTFGNGIEFMIFADIEGVMKD
jgi:hypothetical protein